MEKPILFNTEMVQAIIEGRKTQTRRIVKIPDGFEFVTADKDKNVFLEHILCVQCYKQLKPPCKIGDTLWVRETWCRLQMLDGNENWIEGTERYYYRAGDWPECNMFLKDDGSYSENVPWRPSIHMPRDAARIFLKVTNVRIERLQDITEEGAIKEGFNEVPELFTAKDLFESEWNSIYSKRDYPWAYNPWVWVIEFEKNLRS